MTEIEITPDNLPFHECIGLSVTVKSSCDPTITGLSGIIVDESRNTFQIETNGKIRTIPKTGSVFSFSLVSEKSENGRISAQINGKYMLSQPQNRIKNLKKSRK
ncbi:ribonuclease P protein component 1 [Methanolapillus millepedarum]|uniref:Ribonuclease P protein component 1 n=1 Tax=Methanolapillus millepedarum TaxID=3028296 RepID=A0AA96ZUC5_9EURY|nr:hypothetical protein MsAc7_11320 [Methanosarcinaceae archaeon Ac7]